MGAWRRLGDWLDERVGHRALLAHLLDEPIPGGARWRYVFGSCLLFLFLLQAGTGVLLATCYAPSTGSAWASVAYFEREVPLGWLVRGLHNGGASAMVVVALLHLLQTAWAGAYRRPRELTWWLGLLLLGCVFAFALTGYLLPWDQKGYFATQVVTSLIGAAPLVGGWLRDLVQGGPAYGNLTLTRFYAAHVLVLPALTLALVVAHVGLMRRHGVTPPAGLDEAALEARREPFWPGQLGRDLLAMLGLFALLAAWVVARRHAVTLEAPADPAAAYDARPEWYFLPLFQLLKLVPGRFEALAALAAPLVVFGALFALPLLDRGPSRLPSARKRWLGLCAALLAGALGLGSWAALADARSAGYQRFRARADEAARRALALAAAGVPGRGGTAVWDNDPLRRGVLVHRAHCAGCHVLRGEGERYAPDLDGWSSRAWLRAFLADPEAPRFYAATKVRGMKPVRLPADEIDALIEWIYAEGAAAGERLDAEKVARGKALFAERGCDDCHSSDGETSGDGAPNLGGRATPDWIRAFLRAPGAPRFFDRKNDMPAFERKLADDELEALVTLLAAERRAE
jgi:ubiquinol-cytochrome c reductase cytochrome b subunit